MPLRNEQGARRGREILVSVCRAIYRWRMRSILLATLVLACGCGSSSSGDGSSNPGAVDAGADDATTDVGVNEGGPSSLTDAASCGQTTMKCGKATCDTTNEVCCVTEGNAVCAAKTTCPGFGSDAGLPTEARFECSHSGNCPAGQKCCSAAYPGSICAPQCPIINGQEGPNLCICDSECTTGTCQASPSSEYVWGVCQ